MIITMDTILRKSANIVFRKIANEYILVPIVGSAAEVESIFNLNETGAVVWEKIDAHRTLRDIIQEIRTEYEGEEGQLEKDVLAFVHEMTDSSLLEVCA